MQAGGVLTVIFPVACFVFRASYPAVEPKVSQCACQIHTQQSLYLDALKWLMPSVHTNCDCSCDWCDGGEGCKKWSDLRSLHNFSEELCCAKVDLLEGDPSGGFEYFGRKPACATGRCDDCGFGKPNGIPEHCEALENNAHRSVGWIKFQDQKMADGQVHKKQQVPQQGPLGDLWKEFMTHSLLVSASAARGHFGNVHFCRKLKSFHLMFHLWVHLVKSKFGWQQIHAQLD